jgi:hypothetical protein
MKKITSAAAKKMVLAAGLTCVYVNQCGGYWLAKNTTTGKDFVYSATSLPSKPDGWIEQQINLIK